MGLLTSSPTQNAPPPPAPSSDGAYIAPDRSARQHCWDARDNFFSCLDRNGIVNSIEEKDKVEKVCGAENQRLEGECAKSWVTYFKQRRVMEIRKAETLERLKKEGAKPMPEGMGPPGVQGKTP